MSMLGRRGLLKAAGLAPLAPRGKKQPVPWSNQQFQLLIVSASGGFTGQFDYSPGPGFGNLISSDTAQAGVDPFGNAYLAGNTTYTKVGANWFALNLSGNKLTCYEAASAAGPWNQQAFVEGQSNSLVLSANNTIDITTFTSIAVTSGQALVVAPVPAIPITSALAEIQGSIATTGTVEAIVGGVLETWHTPTFNTGFAGSVSPPAAYQYEPVNGGRVRLRGQVNISAAQVAAATMFTLPAGYRPAYPQNFVTPTSLTGYAAGNPTVTVTAAGAVQIGVATSGISYVGLDGIVIELD